VDNKERTDCRETINYSLVDKRTKEKSETKIRGELRTNFKSIKLRVVEEGKGEGNNKVNTEKIKIMYTNANGLSNKINELKIRVDESKPEIIMVCETKYSSEIGNEGLLLNYDIVRKDRENGMGGGICIFIRNDLRYVEREDLNKFDAGRVEHLWCKISSQEGHKMLTVGIIYRPPSTSDEDNTKLNALLQFVEENTKKEQLFVTGDFNYPRIRWSVREAMGGSSAAFLKQIDNLFWAQNVKEVTRVRLGNEPSLLDLVFTRNKNEVSDVKYCEGLGKSDHIVLEVLVIVESLVKVEERREARNYKKANYLEINRNLFELDWEKKFFGKQVNECYEILIEIINDLVHQFVPLEKHNNKKRNKQRWMNKEVKAAIKKKEKSWENYKKTRNNDNLRTYNRDRNEATRVKRKAKELFEIKLVERIKEDKKNFFDYVRHNT